MTYFFYFGAFSNLQHGRMIRTYFSKCCKNEKNYTFLKFILKSVPLLTSFLEYCKNWIHVDTFYLMLQNEDKFWKYHRKWTLNMEHVLQNVRKGINRHIPKYHKKYINLDTFSKRLQKVDQFGQIWQVLIYFPKYI